MPRSSRSSRSFDSSQQQQILNSDNNIGIEEVHAFVAIHDDMLLSEISENNSQFNKTENNEKTNKLLATVNVCLKVYWHC